MHCDSDRVSARHCARNWQVHTGRGSSGGKNVFDLWLSADAAVIVLVPFAVLYAAAFLIAWVTHKSPARGFFESCIGIPGPFFGCVAILFALFAAFLANDVQRRGADAEAAVFREADSLSTMLRLSEAVGKAADPIRQAVLTYLKVVLEEELPEMRKHGAIPNKVGAIRGLSSAVLSAALPPAVQGAMLESLVSVREARLVRQSLSGDISSPYHWFAVIVLGVLTQVAVAVVQLDKFRPQALALFVFTTAFATTIAFIGIGERPFSGRMIDDEPLREALMSVSP